MSNRLGIAYCSVELIANLMPDGTSIQWLDSERGTIAAFGEGYEKLHKSLQLPANCRITGVSPHARFAYNQIVLRIESPDFVETPEAHNIPEVEPFYNKNGFSHWEGSALAKAR